MSSKDFYNKAEIAARAGVSLSTVNNWMKNGKLPRPDFQATPKTKRWTSKSLKAFFDAYENPAKKHSYNPPQQHEGGKDENCTGGN